MRMFNLSAAVVVAAVFLFGSVGGVSAIEPYDLDSVPLQYQREVRSTYIIQFQNNIAPSKVQGRANAIAARFQGRIVHTYTLALSGFAIRMNSTAMARLMDADDLGIARVSRGVIMTVAQSSDNANPLARKVRPPKETTAECSETLGWNVSRVTPMKQASVADGCLVSGAALGQAPIDYSTSTLKVCVLDTGVSATHGDLPNVTQFNKSSSISLDDNYGHGTHVAGIIGATVNATGVIGVAPGVPITSIKVLGDDGSGSDFDVAAGIELALLKKCDIVNLSLGGSKSEPLDAAIIKASSEGNIVFTLAAGNSSRDIEGYSPARNSTGPKDNIFTIASFGEGNDETGNIIDLWSSFSNYGPNDTNTSMVDFALPGGKILSTVLDNKYATYSGTSMAAPHMAGLIVRYIDGGASTSCNDLSDRRCIGNTPFESHSSVERTLRLGRRVFSSGDYYQIAITP